MTKQDKQREYSKRFCEKNPERVKEIKREYYYRNRDKLLKYKKEYYRNKKYNEGEVYTYVDSRIKKNIKEIKVILKYFKNEKSYRSFMINFLLEKDPNDIISRGIYFSNRFYAKYKNDRVKLKRIGVEIEDDRYHILYII